MDFKNNKKRLNNARIKKINLIFMPYIKLYLIVNFNNCSH